MDNLSTQDIVDADLADWRKLAQRLHARFRTADAAVGAAFVADAVRAAAEAALGDHLEATLTPPHVDLRVATRPARRHLGDAPTTSPSPGWSATWRAARGHLGARRGHPGRARPRHRRRRPARPVLGGRAHRRPRRRRGRHRLRPHGPAAVDVVPGHRAARRAPPALAPRPVGGARGRPRRASPPRSRPAARSSTTPRRRRSRCSPTPTATRSASAPSSTAPDARRVRMPVGSELSG